MTQTNLKGEKVHEFSLNLAWILAHMLNEYDETLDDLGIHSGELSELFMKGKIKHYFDSTALGHYFVIQIPESILKKLKRSRDEK